REREKKASVCARLQVPSPAAEQASSLLAARMAAPLERVRVRARGRGKECCNFLDPASLTAALHGEVLDLLLEPLIAEAAQHDAGAAYSLARQVSVTQGGIELSHFKDTAEPERISYLDLLEHLLLVRQRAALVSLHRSDL